MHPYLLNIKEQVLNSFPEIECVNEIKFIGSYDLDLYSLSEIKENISTAKFKNNNLIFKKNILSEKIPNKEIAIFMINQKYIVTFFDDINLNTDTKVIELQELT